MKIEVSFHVDSVDINPSAKSFKTPEVDFKMEVDCSPEEYLGLLPHILEMRKELLSFWKSAGTSIKELLDQWLPRLWEYYTYSKRSQSQTEEPEEVPSDDHTTSTWIPPWR